MNLYENGFQCLETYQKNGESAFLPGELLVRMYRPQFSQFSGNKFAVELINVKPTFLVVCSSKPDV